MGITDFSIDNSHCWKMIRKLNVHEIIKTFLWLVAHGRILTNKRKHLMQLRTPFCNQCSLEVETTPSFETAVIQKLYGSIQFQTNYRLIPSIIINKYGLILTC